MEIVSGLRRTPSVRHLDVSHRPERRDLSLLDDADQKLPWSWGKGHKPRELWTVSGGTELSLAPGQTHELPMAEIVIGKDTASPTAMAILDVQPGQTYRLVCKLGTYGYAKGEGEPLESGQVQFRVGIAAGGN